jgi:hypothetical protein
MLHSQFKKSIKTALLLSEDLLTEQLSKMQALIEQMNWDYKQEAYRFVNL